MGKKASDAPAAPAAPKAKAPSAPKAAEPKAKAEAPAPAKAKAPGAEAPVAAKAKATASPAAPKAKAAAEAPSIAKAAVQAPPASVNAKVAAAPKGGTSKAPAASPAASAAPVKATAKAPASAAVPKAESKASAKAKAKAATFEPPPREEEFEEEVKKKKTRRGGGKKKAADEDPALTASQQAAEQALALKRAEAEADKDDEYQGLKKQVGACEGLIAKGGTTQALRKEIEQLSESIDKLILAKKAKAPKGSGPSYMLAMSLEELETAEGEDFDAEMLEDVRQQLADARAAEVFTALRMKLIALKARCDAAAKSLASVQTSPNTNEKGTGRSDAAEEKKEAAAVHRLTAMHGREGEVIPASNLIKKNLELEPDVMKYMFGPPFYFNTRFERSHLVIIEANRGTARGTVPKEVTITGLSFAEVENCASALKAIDVSEMQTKEVDFGYSRTKEIENELGVLVFKQRTSTTVFGSKANVDKAFQLAASPKAAIETLLSETLTISSSKVKGLLPLLNGWRITTGAQIKVATRSEDEEEPEHAHPVTVTISARTKQEIEDAKAKVKAFDKATHTELVEGDVTKVMQNRQGFRDTCSSHPDVQVVRKESGLQLSGPAVEVKALKDKLLQMLKKATVDTVQYSVPADKLRIFNRDNLVLISKNSGADVRRSRDSDNSLAITGTSDAVQKAKLEIEEVIVREGASDSVDLSEDLIKSLFANTGAKIKDVEKKTGVSIKIDKKEGKAALLGSNTAIEACKEEFEKLQAQIDKEIAETFIKDLILDPAHVRFVIGPKGSVLKNIRETCGVQVTVRDGDDGMSHAEIKGLEDDVLKAELMIQEIVANADVAKAAAKPKPKPKPTPAPDAGAKPQASPRKAEYKGAVGDFPTLGGGDSQEEAAAQKPVAVGSAWGKKPDQKQAIGSGGPQNHFPTLAAKAQNAKAAVTKETVTTAPSKESETVQEEEEAADFDDPFALMGGMGQEEVYKISLDIEPTVRAVDYAVQDEEEQEDDHQEQGLPRISKFIEDKEDDEEEEEQDEENDEDETYADDPFAMMSGMGQEEVYKVSLDIEPTARTAVTQDDDEVDEEEEEEEEENKAEQRSYHQKYEEDAEEEGEEEEAHTEGTTHPTQASKQPAPSATQEPAESKATDEPSKPLSWAERAKLASKR